LGLRLLKSEEAEEHAEQQSVVIILKAGKVGHGYRIAVPYHCQRQCDQVELFQLNLPQGAVQLIDALAQSMVIHLR